jgi:redox-sensing transcriptional repressor
MLYLYVNVITITSSEMRCMTPRVRQIPLETADRLVTYLRPLLCLQGEGTTTVSSKKIAEMCRVKAPVVRKDFSYLGNLGTRGVGYSVAGLIKAIKRELRLDEGIALIVVGVGNIGRALLEQPRLDFEGFRIVAAFDNDPSKIGRTFGKTVVEDVAGLEERISAEAIQLAILTVPEATAPKMARRLGEVGVRSILSFAPCRIAMPQDVDVTCMDLSVLMAQLVYHSHREDEQAAQ